MKKSVLLQLVSILFLLCTLQTKVLAQTEGPKTYNTNTSEKELKLGDKIPMRILRQNMPVITDHGNIQDSIRLSDYSGKLIILDFWASWCSTCIYKFTAIEQLQKKFNKEIKVILVNTKNTKDTPSRMSGILSGKKAPFISSLLPSIYNDIILDQLFPHKYLPHYVWIGEKGELKAISGTELLTEATIVSLLETERTKNQ